MVIDLFTTSILAIPLISAVALLRLLTVYILPKKTFYIFWIIVLLRLLVPFDFFLDYSIYNIVHFDLKESTAVTMVREALNKSSEIEEDKVSDIFLISDMKSSDHEIHRPDVSDTSSILISRIILTVWCAGFSCCTLYFIFANIKFHKKYAESLPLENSFIRGWRVEQSDTMRRGIKIKQSEVIDSPLTYGILNPVILLPKTMDYSDESTLKYVLYHEYTHIKRLDIVIKLLLTTVLCLHWFNPFIWIMYILASHDIELSCDEAVISKISTNKTIDTSIKSDYALTLISMEETKSRLSLLSSHFSKNIMTERIKSIMKTKRASKAKILAAVILVYSVTVLFPISPISAENIAVDTDIITDKAAETKIVTELKVTMPQGGWRRLPIVCTYTEVKMALPEKGRKTLLNAFAVIGENIKSVAYQSENGIFVVLKPFCIEGEFSGYGLFPPSSNIVLDENDFDCEVELWSAKLWSDIVKKETETETERYFTDTITVTVTYSNGKIATQRAKITLNYETGKVSTLIIVEGEKV